VFEGWDRAFPDLTAVAVDLQEGVEVATATHEDYARAVVETASGLPSPVALCGWSMGGLAALQAAQRVDPQSVVLLESSPPGETQGFDESIEPQPGTFDPEEVYGRFPPGMRSRSESSPARAERKRGISVPTLPCRSLVVSGDDFREERGSSLAALYGSELMDFPGLGHWDLVRWPDVRRRVADWLGRSS
jgi:predicted alpha/beta hydrolase family esterase